MARTQRFPWIRRHFAASASTHWTGISQYAMYFQVIFFLIAAAQFWFGIYIFQNLVKYSKWAEPCHAPYLNETLIPWDAPPLSPPMTIYADLDMQPGQEHFGLKSIGGFGNPGNMAFLIWYGFFLPALSCFIATVVCLQTVRQEITMRFALYTSAFHMLNLLWWFTYQFDKPNDSTLTVDWEQQSDPDWPICIVHDVRGAQILRARERRMKVLQARGILAGIAGVLMAIYIILTLLGVRAKAKKQRIAEIELQAAERVNNLRASVAFEQNRVRPPPNAHIHTTARSFQLNDSSEVAAPVAATTSTPRHPEDEAGDLSTQRWAEERSAHSREGSWTVVDLPSRDPESAHENLARSRDVV